MEVVLATKRRPYRLEERERRSRRPPFTGRRLVSLILRATADSEWRLPSLTALNRLANILNGLLAYYRGDREHWRMMEQLAQLDDLAERYAQKIQTVINNAAKLPSYAPTIPRYATVRAEVLSLTPRDDMRRQFLRLGPTARRQLDWTWSGPALANDIAETMRSANPAYPEGTGETGATVAIMERVIPGLSGERPPRSTIETELRKRRKLVAT